MTTKKTVLPKAIFKTLAVASLFAISLPASADREDRHGGEGWHEGRHEDFRGGGDIRRFDRHDYGVWRSGKWRHARHEGRLGWWWVVGGLWYFYPQAVYPSPDPYIPPVVTQTTQPAAPPPAQYWYFCSSSNSYYPYVASCPDGWKTVPATPPAPSPGVPAQ